MLVRCLRKTFGVEARCIKGNLMVNLNSPAEELKHLHASIHPTPSSPQTSQSYPKEVAKCLISMNR